MTGVPPDLANRAGRDTYTVRLASGAACMSPTPPEASVMTGIESFLIEIDRIPWFANLGKPSELDGEALRITSWEAWPGPNRPGCELMHEAQQDRHDRLLAAAGDPRGFEVFWQRIHDRVLMRASPCVPWKENEDVYYGPNLAVGDAAWNAALVGISGALGIDLDQGGPGGAWTLASEWRWLRAGHWPCAFFWQWGETTLEGAARSHVHDLRQLIVF